MFRVFAFICVLAATCFSVAAQTNPIVPYPNFYAPLNQRFIIDNQTSSGFPATFNITPYQSYWDVIDYAFPAYSYSFKAADPTDPTLFEKAVDSEGKLTFVITLEVGNADVTANRPDPEIWGSTVTGFTSAPSALGDQEPVNTSGAFKIFRVTAPNQAILYHAQQPVEIVPVPGSLLRADASSTAAYPDGPFDPEHIYLLRERTYLWVDRFNDNTWNLNFDPSGVPYSVNPLQTGELVDVDSIDLLMGNLPNDWHEKKYETRRKQLKKLQDEMFEMQKYWGKGWLRFPDPPTGGN